MGSEIFSEIRNKFTAPKISLEKLAKGERVLGEFLDLAARSQTRPLRCCGDHGTLRSGLAHFKAGRVLALWLRNDRMFS